MEEFFMNDNGALDDPNATDLAGRFLDLEEQKKTLEEQVKVLESSIKDLDSEMYRIGKQLMELFIEKDMQSIKMRGRTLYIHNQKWAKPKDKNLERAIIILKEIGMGWLVKESVNTHTVSSYVRENDNNEAELHPRFFEAFEVQDSFSIRSRSSGK